MAALEGTVSISALTDEYQTKFTKRLLKHAVQLTVLDQFGEMYDLPANEGATTFRVWKRAVANADNVKTITETDFTTLRDTPTYVTHSYVDVTLSQIGQSAKVTKIVGMTALLDHLKANIQRMGEEAALYLDNVVRNALCHATTGLNKTYPRGVANFAAFAAQTPSAAKLTGEAGLDNVTQLGINRAPPWKGGEYVGVTPFQGGFDLMQATRWIEASKYAGATQLFKGEMGMLDGVRYVRHSNPHIADRAGAEGTHAPGTAAGARVYTTLFLGRDAYAVPKLAGTTSPKAPKLIILRDPDKYDPAGQFTMVTWTAFFGILIQDATYGLAHKHMSTFGVVA